MEEYKYRLSRHSQQRMGQRGITRDMIDLVLQYGTPQHNRTVVLTRKDSELLLAKMKVLKKILDKGGVVVVEDNRILITAYNYES